MHTVSFCSFQQQSIGHHVKFHCNLSQNKHIPSVRKHYGNVLNAKLKESFNYYKSTVM